jgi:hypothetical protein
MSQTPRPGAGRGRFAVILGILLIAGCSAAHPAVSAPGHDGSAQLASAGGSGLCAQTGQVTGGFAVRNSGIPQDHLRFSLPARQSFRSAALTRALARQACELHRNTMANCPADFGVRYILTFLSRSQIAGKVTASPGGCLTVQLGSPAALNGVPRSPLRLPPGLLGTQQFWIALGNAMGIAPSSANHVLSVLGPHPSS